ncbi:MAG: hypothetical protein ACJ759_21080 [Thermoanaerobaculia bacterium]
MAFRFKDLMIQVIPSSGTGGDEQICTLASKVDEDPAGAVPPCTPASSPAAIVPCTLATKVEPAYVTCTPATAPAAIVPCTLASQIPPTFGAFGAAGGGTAAAITTVTTVTTVTTLVAGAGAGAGASNLPSLKQQLRQALDQVEAQERAAAQAQPRLPQTVEESDDLARRLREAIEELQEHRKSLQQPGASAKKARKGKR